MRSAPPTPVETKSYLCVQNSIVEAADPAMVCVSKLGHSSGIAKQVQLGKSVWPQNVGHGTTRNKWPNCMIVLVLAKIDSLSSYSIVHMKCPGNHVQPLWVPCCLSHRVGSYRRAGCGKVGVVTAPFPSLPMKSQQGCVGRPDSKV